MIEAMTLNVVENVRGNCDRTDLKEEVESLAVLKKECIQS